MPQTLSGCHEHKALAFVPGVIFGAFQRCVVAFRVAGVAFRDMWRCLATCRKSVKRGRRNAVATLAEDVLHFSCQERQVQHFGHVQLHAQHFRSVVLRVSPEWQHWQGYAKW